MVVTDYHSDLYSERVLEYLSRSQNVLVLAQRDKKRNGIEKVNNLSVCSVWEPGNNLSILNLFRYVFRYSRAHNILFQFEHKTFGGKLPLVLLPAILLVLRWLGKYTYVELHRFKFTDQFAPWFYHAIGLTAGKVIILDKRYKKKLSGYIPEEKIAVLPLIGLRREKLPRRKTFKLSLRHVMKTYRKTVSRSYHIPPSNLVLKIK